MGVARLSILVISHNPTTEDGNSHEKANTNPDLTTRPGTGDGGGQCVALAAWACWWAVLTQPRVELPDCWRDRVLTCADVVERRALQDAHSATAPSRTVAVSVHAGRRAGSSA